MLDDEERGFENAGLDYLHFYSLGQGRLVLGGVGVGVDFVHGVRKLAPDRHPFGGFKVVVLEEKEERRRAEEGGVLSVELGFALFGSAVGRRLSWWIEGHRGWMLLDEGCRSCDCRCR